MGRELKRVALDFDWPLEKVWKGYINALPWSEATHQCLLCEGSGESALQSQWKKLWYGNIPFKPGFTSSTPFASTHPIIVAKAERTSRSSVHVPGPSLEALRLCHLFNGCFKHHLEQVDVDALIAKGRLKEFTHDYETGKGWTPKFPSVTPTAQQVNEWSLVGFGHDSMNQWIVCKNRCNQAGISSTCHMCEGEGYTWRSEELKSQHESWENFEPPSGEGYQIWETVSEGSPISPVFKTPEDLASYMAERPWGADSGSSYESWIRMIKSSGWAPSMAFVGGQVVTGVDFVAEASHD